MSKMSTWEAMKKTADKNELRELQLIELQNLKARQKFYADTPPKERRDMMKNNVEVRKLAKKILPNEDDLNKFMYARSWEAYAMPMTNALNKVQKKAKQQLTKKEVDYVNTENNLRNTVLVPFEGNSVENAELGKDINKDRSGLDTIVYYNEGDKQKADQVKKEAVEFGDPSTWDKHVDQFLEDSYKGIGSIETPNQVTKNAVRDLKDIIDDYS